MKLQVIVLSVALTVPFIGCNKNSVSKDTTVIKETQSDAEQEEQLKKEKLEQEKIVRRKVIQEAIAIYRYTEEKKDDGKVPAFELAWRIIVDTGKEGAEEVKKELQKVADSGESDDGFETAASLLLWEIGGLAEAETVAAIWKRIPLTLNYNGIFFAALAAAKTKDPRALPMLKACLASQDGRVFVYQTGVKLAWPQTHELLWGVYGPTGLPFLNDVLKLSVNTVEQKSAIRILTAAGHLRALPVIRALADRGIGVVKFEAIRAIGSFGHPDDYDNLVAGLSSDVPDEVISCAYALLNFGDLRATDEIVPLATTENPRVKSAALSAISYLLTPDTITVLNKCSRREKDEKTKARCKSLLNQAQKRMNVSKKKYMASSKSDRAELTNKVHKLAEISYLLATGDQQLTSEEFNKTLEEWTKNQTIQGGTYDWVRSRHILGAATSKDIGKLLDVRAALYSKLSGQSLAEVGLINEMVKHLVRREYRKPTGIAQSVEPVN